MALSLNDVAQALNGTKLDYLNTTTGFQQIRGNRLVTNADGSITIPANGSNDPVSPGLNSNFTYVGSVPKSGGGQYTGVVTFFVLGSPLTVFVVGFDGTHVLLEGLSLSGGSYVPNANRFLVTSNGGPDLALDVGVANPASLTLFLTGTTYTSPGGTTVTSVPCFGRGTLISTPGGQTAVEDIAVGSYVLNRQGRRRRVVWTGARQIDIARHPRPDLVRPVTIAKDAFGRGRPARDLTVSPDHNILVGKVLIPAKCLVNGRNVTLSDATTVSYHHIELNDHDIVRAEGLPTETYLDTGNRNAFAGGQIVDAFPDFASAPDINYFAWEARGCAPLVLAGPDLDAARARLAANADKRAAQGKRRAAA